MKLPATPRQLVIVGHGMATRYLLEALRQRSHDWRIIVISAEAEGHYNRIQLSPLLAGEIDEQALRQSCDEGEPLARYGVAVTHIDSERRQLTLDDGSRFTYDALVLATGARATMPDIDGLEARGVHTFRTLADTRRLGRLPKGCPVAVIGGGLLGIEAAAGLASRGHPVRLLHRRPVLMNQQLDATASELLVEALRNRGVQLHLGVTPSVLATRSGRVSGVVLREGAYLAASAVICATGISPRVELGHIAGCATARGIVVDQHLATSIPGIYALGECCEFRGRTYGLVVPIRDQAQALAAQLCGQPASYSDQPFVTRLKVSGLNVHSLGEQPADAESITWIDRRLGDYRRVWLRDNRVVGALLVGEVSDSEWYLQLLREGTDTSSIRPYLLFGQPWCEQAA